MVHSQAQNHSNKSVPNNTEDNNCSFDQGREGVLNGCSHGTQVILQASLWQATVPDGPQFGIVGEEADRRLQQSLFIVRARPGKHAWKNTSGKKKETFTTSWKNSVASPPKESGEEHFEDK